MKNILVLSNSISGLFSFRKEVFKSLIDHKFNVFIVCPKNKNKEKFEWFKNIGCTIIDLDFNRHGTNPFKDIQLIFNYYRIIKTVKPDLILTYTIKPNIYGGIASSLMGIPQIANVTGLGAAVENSGMIHLISVFLYKIGFNKTRLVFFQNEENLNFCVKHKILNGKSRLIPGSGVNLEYHTLKKYPKESEPIRFIFISRIRKEKGIDQYLTAAEYIKNKYPNTEFHILGICEDNYLDKINCFHDKKIVIYHGLQSDVRPFIEQCHCTIHPSFYPEGMSNVLLESCAVGRPIITTDKAGCREIVDIGINGYVVKQKDSEDLISKIEEFINLPYKEKFNMGIASRKKVEKEFDRNFVIRAYLEEINKILF